jgi:predicted amidohydrolase
VARLKVAAVQLGDQPCTGFDDYARHVRLLLEAAGQSTLIVFPEYCTLPLIKSHAPVTRAELRAAYDETFSAHTDRYLELFGQLSRERGLHILAGTHWLAEGGVARNVAHFFSPDGRHQTVAKRRRTAAEEAMGMGIGDGDGMVSVADVRVGVLVCYDCEFPELAMSMAQKGADILLVPSLTLNERGFNRVQICSRARAVENQVYVVMSANQTALEIPTEKPVRGFGQSGIFGPIDNRTGLLDGVVARSAVDGDCIVWAELDLDVLTLSRENSEAPLRRHRAHP